MIRSKKLALTSFLTVFLIGLVLGVVVERFVLDKRHSGRKPHDANEYIMKKFTERLSLNEEQKSELKIMLDEVKEKYSAIRKGNREKYGAVQEEFNEKFRQILSEEQQVIFAQIQKEFEEKRKRYNKKRDDKK